MSFEISYEDEYANSLLAIGNPVIIGLRNMAYRLIEKCGGELDFDVIEFCNEKLKDLSLKGFIGQMLSVDTKLALVETPDLPETKLRAVTTRGLDFIGIAGNASFKLFEDVTDGGEHETKAALVATFIEPQIPDIRLEGSLLLPDMKNSEVYRLSRIDASILHMRSCQPPISNNLVAYNWPLDIEHCQQ